IPAPRPLASVPTRRSSDLVSALSGPSGVGKSSLINALHPELDLRVGEISAVTGKGRHTTTATTLILLDDETYIADTPGIRQLGRSEEHTSELQSRENLVCR